MRTMYEKFMTYSLLRAVILGILGVLMLFFPDFLLGIIVFVFAGFLILNGLLGIISYLRSSDKSQTSFDFIVGCLLIVLGIVAIIFSRQLVSILPIFLGVLMVLGGATYFANAMGAGSSRNWLLVILAVVIIIGGVVVIFNPFASLITLFRIFGVLLILACAEELITYFTYKRAVK